MLQQPCFWYWCFLFDHFYITERSIAAIDKNEEELKQAKEAAERANAAKPDFVPNVT